MVRPERKEVLRTPVENAFLAEMVQDDREYILRGNMEAAVDDIISPVNTAGLFDDSVSSDDDLEDLLGYDDDEYNDLF